MTLRWPSERKSANQQPPLNSSFKTEQDFHKLVACLENFPATLDQTADWIAKRGGDITELEQRVTKVCNPANFQTLSDSTNMLLTWCCAIALARYPSVHTWKNVRNFSYHSSAISHWLTYAMMVQAEIDSNARTAYIQLAKEVFSALDSFTLTSPNDRTNSERLGAWTHWVECQEKLDEVWWGLRRWNPMSYEGEFPHFHALNKLDPDEFIKLVGQSSNPYLVSSVLIAAEAGGFTSRFLQWKKLATNAPNAFEVDGTWNGSILAPLLLLDASDQLLQAGKNIPRFDASDTDVEATKQEISSVADAVVTVLATRQDALPLFARWTTWLMRHLLSHPERDADDVRSAAFVYDSLLHAIGRKLRGQAVIQASPADAPTWEAWCYRCVLALHAYNNFIDPPSSIDFLAEWAITPDEWMGKAGKSLRERSSFIVSMSKGIPGTAANLLAYPIIQSASPVAAWIEMWNVTYALREIVEFGDSDIEDDEYHSRSEAGKLLLFVFRIGLAILDQRITQCSDSNSIEARSQADLYARLVSAVHEMREIDDTLNREEWINAIQHLAIRRLIWECPDDSKPGHFSIFLPEDAPTFSDFLKMAKSDPMELLAILQSAILNDLDTVRFQTELNLASINLSDFSNMVRRLNQYSPRRYPIDEVQLRRIESLSTVK